MEIQDPRLIIAIALQRGYALDLDGDKSQQVAIYEHALETLLIDSGGRLPIDPRDAQEVSYQQYLAQLSPQLCA
jgi:hypothetical protein